MTEKREKMITKLFEQMMEERTAQFDYKQLAADIRRKKDDYSRIEHDYSGVVDINQPSTVPFRWEEKDVGKEMVIMDEFGQFGDQRIVELTLTYCDDMTIEFQIDKITLIDISSNDEFKIIDQEEFQSGGSVRLKRGEIITGEQLGQMSDFVYGTYGAPDYKDFSLYALVQYWAHHHVLVQNLYHAAERRALAMTHLETTNAHENRA